MKLPKRIVAAIIILAASALCAGISLTVGFTVQASSSELDKTQLTVTTRQYAVNDCKGRSVLSIGGKDIEYILCPTYGFLCAERAPLRLEKYKTEFEGCPRDGRETSHSHDEYHFEVRDGDVEEISFSFSLPECTTFRYNSTTNKYEGLSVSNNAYPNGDGGTSVSYTVSENGQSVDVTVTLIEPGRIEGFFEKTGFYGVFIKWDGDCDGSCRTPSESCGCALCNCIKCNVEALIGGLEERYKVFRALHLAKQYSFNIESFDNFRNIALDMKEEADALKLLLGVGAKLPCKDIISLIDKYDDALRGLYPLNELVTTTEELYEVVDALMNKGSAHGYSRDLKSDQVIFEYGTDNVDDLLKIGYSLDSVVDGMYTVRGHGYSQGFALRDGRVIDAKQLASLIEIPFEGKPIRLLSCSTGKEKSGIAQQLADILGVTVYAPNDLISISVLNDQVWIGSEDNLVPAGDGTDFTKPGWVKFTPGGGTPAPRIMLNENTEVPAAVMTADSDTDTCANHDHDGNVIYFKNLENLAQEIEDANTKAEMLSRVAELKSAYEAFKAKINALITDDPDANVQMFEENLPELQTIADNVKIVADEIEEENGTEPSPTPSPSPSPEPSPSQEPSSSPSAEPSPEPSPSEPSAGSGEPSSGASSGTGGDSGNKSLGPAEIGGIVGGVIIVFGIIAAAVIVLNGRRKIS